MGVKALFSVVFIGKGYYTVGSFSNRATSNILLYKTYIIL